MADSSVDLATARAFWHSKQGLASALAGTLHDVVAKTGWLRTLGGADVYLAARARSPSLKRSALDSAVSSMELRVLPAVRGCIYLVPRVHAALAMRFAEGVWRKGASRDLDKVGVGWTEIEAVAAAARETLAGGALSTDALRRAMPTGSVRSFGDAGKKLGMSSPLPLALRSLEFAGVVERTLEGGRLDTERYLWRLAAKNPFDGVSVPSDASALARALTSIFVAQMGPVTARHVAEWAGIGVTVARDAAVELGLSPIAVTGYAEDAWIAPDELDALHAARAQSGSVSFLSFEDNYFVPHGGPGLFVDAAFHGLGVREWGPVRQATLGTSRHLATRTVVIGGEIAGFWELDPDANRVEVGYLATPGKGLRGRVEEEAEALGRFLVEEIGHGHAYSLDTDDALRDRLKLVRSLESAPAKSVTKKPITKKPTAKRPIAKKPAANKPAANKPAANKPAANKPAAKKR